MQGSKKTKADLVKEVEKLRARVSSLEESERELKRVHDESRNISELLDRMFSAAHPLIAYMDKEFTFLRVNRAYAEADGRTPEFFVGKKHFDLYPHEENEKIFQSVIATGQPFSVRAKPFEYAEHPERGVTYWDWSLQPVKNASGEVEGLVLCLVDVTERMRAEAEIKRYARGLEALVESRTAELRNVNEQLRQEIAERKLIEEELRREKVFSEMSREFVQSALDALSANIAVLDQYGRITMVNQAWVEFANENGLADQNYCVGADYLAVCRSEENESVDNPHPVREGLSAVLSGQTARFEFEYPCSGPQEERWFQLFATPFTHAGQNWAVIAHIDITERKRAEEKLRFSLDESRRHSDEMDALLKSSKAVLSNQEFARSAREIFDSCKELVGATAGYIALLSQDGSQNELLFLDSGGLPCRVDPSLPMPVRGLRAEAYLSKKAIYENNFRGSEWEQLMPTGHAELVSVMFAPLILNKEAVGLIGLANKPGGFTERDAELASAFADHAAIALQNSRSLEALKRSEKRYRRLSHALEATVKKKVAELRQAENLAAIGRLISIVAHEIRNPLQNIRMGIDTLDKGIGKDEEKREIIGEVKHGINLLNGIVTELLEYSKPIQLERTYWPLREVVRQALGSMRNKLETVRVHVNLEYAEKEISVDVAKFNRVLVNLIANSVEAMPDGGDLRISTRFIDPEGSALLEMRISDTGCGIEEENLGRIFDPFFTTKNQGTGLGISICRNIIQAHGGTMTVSSEVNQGTTVTITLPVES